MTQELEGKQSAFDARIQALKTVESFKNRLKEEMEQLRELRRVASYAEINWQDLAIAIKNLSDEKAALQQSSDILHTLQNQLAENLAQSAG